MVGAVLGPEWARALFCFLLVVPSLGFVRAPFSRWTRGEVIMIDPASGTFTLREGASRKVMTIHWSSETRFWVEPFAKKDRGAIFENTDLHGGEVVRVMFKKKAKENNATRIIRLPAVVREK